MDVQLDGLGDEVSSNGSNVRLREALWPAKVSVPEGSLACSRPSLALLQLFYSRSDSPLTDAGTPYEYNLGRSRRVVKCTSRGRWSGLRDIRASLCIAAHRTAGIVSKPTCTVGFHKNDLTAFEQVIGFRHHPRQRSHVQSKADRFLLLHSYLLHDIVLNYLVRQQRGASSYQKRNHGTHEPWTRQYQRDAINQQTRSIF